MEESGVSELASTLQFGSIKRNPSPRHDINPSTAASEKQPVTLDKSDDIDSDVDEDEIPVSALKPVPRKQTMPPLPDLRFEQSYLKSIEKAESWQAVAWITLRDHVLMCFAQGLMWTLILSGWRRWNRSAKFGGKSVGAKIRRWWWGVNNWKIPDAEAKLKDTKLAKNVSEYYKGEFSTAAQD